MSDISDLHGVFAPPLRWNAEGGVLGYGVYDDATGERTINVIELNSPASKFAMDLATRERGYGLIRKGVYDFHLTPVGSPPPEWPGDDDYKAAIGVWMWNPVIGECRLETNGAILSRVISGLWDRCRNAKEAREGKQPVVHFVGRREQEYPLGTYWAPVIDIVGWLPRENILCFARRPVTVKPPTDGNEGFALLQGPKQTILPQQPILSKPPVVPQKPIPPRPERPRREVKGKPAAAPKDSNFDERRGDPLPDNLR